MKQSHHKQAKRATHHVWLPPKKRISASIAMFSAVAFIGSVLILSSHAATSLASSEAESGVRSGNASQVNDTTASGGSYVSFGGSTAAVSCDQAGIQKLVDSVSAANLEANLRELVQDDSKPKPNELISRHVSQPGNQIKVDWAKQQLASYGLQVIDQQFKSGNYTLNNVIGRIPGSDTKNFYGASGHIDTINIRETGTTRSDPAPGAEDNGSGVVAAMEAGRVLKAFQPCMKATLDFTAFNDEEEGFLGNSTYVAKQKAAGMVDKGWINMDMVSYTPQGECLHNYYNKSAREKFLTDKLTAVNTKYGISLPMTSESYTEEDQDAVGFWDQNEPAIFENACVSDTSYPGYHKTTDNVKYVNFTQLSKMTKLIVASLAELSMQ